MTMKQIQAKQDREAMLQTLMFDTAKEIRRLLDDCKKRAGSIYEDRSWEDEILEMVSEPAPM